MDEKKALLRIVMIAIVFVLLFVSIVFGEMLGQTVVAVMRLAAIIIGVIFLGFYNKKLR